MTRASRAARFTAVGAVGTALQIAALWLLADVVGVAVLVATPLAVLVAVGHNFACHWLWTYRDRAHTNRLTPAFLRFAAANGGVSLVGNSGITATLVAGAHIDAVAANVVAIGVCGVLNLWLADTMVFQPDRRSAG